MRTFFWGSGKQKIITAFTKNLDRMKTLKFGFSRRNKPSLVLSETLSGWLINWWGCLWRSRWIIWQYLLTDCLYTIVMTQHLHNQRDWFTIISRKHREINNNITIIPNNEELNFSLNKYIWKLFKVKFLLSY